MADELRCVVYDGSVLNTFQLLVIQTKFSIPGFCESATMSTIPYNRLSGTIYSLIVRYLVLDIIFLLTLIPASSCSALFPLRSSLCVRFH